MLWWTSLYGKQHLPPWYSVSHWWEGKISQTIVSGATSLWMVGYSYSPLSEKQNASKFLLVSWCASLTVYGKNFKIVHKPPCNLKNLDPNQQKEPVQQTQKSMGTLLPWAFSFCRGYCNISPLHSWGHAPRWCVKWQLCIKHSRGCFILQELQLSSGPERHYFRGEKSDTWGKMMAVFNSLEMHVVQDKLGLFCVPHRAEPQPLQQYGWEAALESTETKTLGVKSGFCVPRCPFHDGTHRKSHLLPPEPWSQTLMARLWGCGLCLVPPLLDWVLVPDFTANESKTGPHQMWCSRHNTVFSVESSNFISTQFYTNLSSQESLTPLFPCLIHPITSFINSTPKICLAAIPPFPSHCHYPDKGPHSCLPEALVQRPNWFPHLPSYLSWAIYHTAAGVLTKTQL